MAPDIWIQKSKTGNSLAFLFWYAIECRSKNVNCLVPRCVCSTRLISFWTVWHNSCWCFSIGFDGLLTRTRSAGEDETISNCDTFFVSYEYTAICVRFKHFWIPHPPNRSSIFFKAICLKAFFFSSSIRPYKFFSVPRCWINCVIDSIVNHRNCLKYQYLKNEKDFFFFFFK